MRAAAPRVHPWCPAGGTRRGARAVGRKGLTSAAQACAIGEAAGVYAQYDTHALIAVYKPVVMELVVLVLQHDSCIFELALGETCENVYS